MRDFLGEVELPDHLLDLVKEESVRIEKQDAQRKAKEAEAAAKAPTNGWKLVEKRKGSSGSVHTIEYLRNAFGDVQLRCTCQSFKIRKQGRCKHTDTIDPDALP